MITGRAGNRLEENSIDLPHLSAVRFVRPQTFSCASRHPACDPDAQDIHPALVKIEQVRIEQRTDDVLNDNNQANPGCEVRSAE
jgi:hypothetical protein